MANFSYTTSDIDSIRKALSMIASMQNIPSIGYKFNDENTIAIGYKPLHLNPTEEQLKLGYQKGDFLVFTCFEQNEKSGFVRFPAPLHNDALFEIIKDWYRAAEPEQPKWEGDGSFHKAIKIESGDIYCVDPLEYFHVQVVNEYIGK